MVTAGLFFVTLICGCLGYVYVSKIGSFLDRGGILFTEEEEDHGISS